MSSRRTFGILISARGLLGCAFRCYGWGPRGEIGVCWRAWRSPAAHKKELEWPPNGLERGARRGRSRILWPDIGCSNAFCGHILTFPYTYSRRAFNASCRHLVAPYSGKRARRWYHTRTGAAQNGASTALGSMRRRGIAKKRLMIQKRAANRHRKNFRAGFFSWRAPIAYRESRKSYGIAKVVSYSAR